MLNFRTNIRNTKKDCKNDKKNLKRINNHTSFFKSNKYKNGLKREQNLKNIIQPKNYNKKIIYDIQSNKYELNSHNQNTIKRISITSSLIATFALTILCFYCIFVYYNFSVVNSIATSYAIATFLLSGVITAFHFILCR